MGEPVTCMDYRGRSVLVPPDLAIHVAQRHREMEEHLEQICRVVEAPDAVYFRERTDSHFFYRSGVLSGKLERNYMVVIVRYSGFSGAVRTAFSTGRPAAEDTLIYFRWGKVAMLDTLGFDFQRFKESNKDYLDRIQKGGINAIYDAALDTMFIEIGGPAEALSEHLIDNIMVRIDPETLKIVGFEILDFLDDFLPANRMIREACRGWQLDRNYDSEIALLEPQYAPMREVVEALIGQITRGAASAI